ncbi:bifunctional hydroxymethylpyrimidine kinase/phosphomethylpyrimidine kinase [Inquilinus sp. CA228]|uniref:bifunctional hydroxymethylpyrimidine kinase/phosphomethylpyrimidine kinase n=1 Tax=Inquilinus sp. CA228 TaxID=3455609 RepID=UPI003F8D2C89
MTSITLTIAGSDSSGGAGIQGDLKTISALGSYGCTALTAVTAQNTIGVAAIVALAPEFVRQQIDAVFADLDVSAVKIGMLHSAATVEAVAEALEFWQPRWIVLDPVMVAKGGDNLLDPAAIAILRSRLMPLASLVTPNLPEAAALLDEGSVATRGEMPLIADRLRAEGAAAVLLKGGHLEGDDSPDFLDCEGARFWLCGARVPTRRTHGTGCTLSAAIAALLAQELSLPDAVRVAKTYVADAIAAADVLAIGRGRGPVHHFHDLWKAKSVIQKPCRTKPADAMR